MCVMDHLHSRYLDTDLHTVWVDEEQGVATFPLWNLTGQMVGYQQYRPHANKKKDNHPKESRYFTYRKNQVVGLWGLESWNKSKVLFVTEGVFDAARLTHRGYSAVATLSNDVAPSLKRWLWCVRQFRDVVFVCDGDAAGLRLAKLGNRSHVMPSGDLGAASHQTVTDLLAQYG